MKNAIIIHGCCSKSEFYDQKYPSGSNSHWVPWLQKQLITNGIETQTPEMPCPYKPNFEEWEQVLKQFQINNETTIIAHSCAAGFIIRWLQQTENKIDHLILVAPWLDPIKNRPGFLDFEVTNQTEELTNKIDILSSNNDPVEGVKESVEIIQTKLQSSNLHILENMGHFTLGDMKTTNFPDLLRLILL